MSSYFSNTEYHLESRRESVTGLHCQLEQGNRSALGTAVSFSLYNSDGFSQELNHSGNAWDMALGMSNDVATGIFNRDVNTGNSSAFENKLVLGLSQAVSSRTFSEFDSNIANSLKDSRNSLKFLMGEAYRIDPTETKAYASQLVFENIFGSVLKQKGMYLGDNRNTPQNYYADQSYEFSSVFEHLRMNDKQSIESRGQETLDRLVYSDLFGGGLVPVMGPSTTQQDVNSFYDNAFNNKTKGAGNTISDLDFIRSKSMTNELVGGNVTRTTRSVRGIDVAVNNSYQQKAEGIIHDIKYQTRPGILPFVAMFESAHSSITIDSFQYQNRAISNVVVSKIYREIITNKNYNFKVNLTVGTPLPDENGTSNAIFGPNLLEVAKMQQLQSVITNQLKANGVSQDIIDQVNNNFNIQLAGPAHHRKVYITDQVAVLGSINLTSPVGDSVFKAGSNFEMLGMFHRDVSLINIRNNKQVVPYNLDYVEKVRKEQAQTKQALNSNIGRRTRSALMYEQVVAAQSEQLQTRSSQANIKYATDIMYTLKATVDYLHYETSRTITNNNLENIQGKLTSDLSMTMVLDQAYLLHVNHLDNRDYKIGKDINKNNLELGEMGRFSEDEYKSNAFRSKQDVRYEMYKSIQKKNFMLVALGITNIVVDSKNFRSQVIEPTWDFINLRLGDTFINKYGGSIGGFVGGITNANSTFGAKVTAINKALNITDRSSNTAYQILAIASGNISGATVPRQHAKAFEAKRSLGGNKYESIAAVSANSANFSMSNMGVSTNNRYLKVGENDPYVTDEMGAVFVNRVLFETARNETLDDDFKRNIDALNLGFTNEYSLEFEETLSELKDASRAVVMSYNQLNYGNRLENSILQSIEGLPYWAKQSNTGDLLKLEASLKQMSKGLGDAMSINRKYDRFGTPLMLEISINPSALVGLNTASSRLTYTLGMLQGTANQPGPVFFQKQGKLIYNSNFTNTTGRDIVWNYGDKEGRLASGHSAELSSIDNTTSIFATMIAELMYKQTISNPINKIGGIDDVGARSLLLDYTSSVLGINRYLLSDTTNGVYIDGASYSDYLFEQKSHIKLAFELESRFSTIGIRHLDIARTFAKIDVFDDARSIIREHIRSIRNATNGAEVYSGIDAISKLLGKHGYEDLALEVLRVNNRYNAEGDLNAQVRDLSTNMLDPYLQAHQANYGASVPASKMITYGLDSTNSQALDLIEMGARGELDILNYARTFARDVSVYSGFGLDYDNNERFYLGGVAEGVSTQNKDGYQLDAFGIRNKFPTDRNSLDILESTGMANLISKERLLKRFSNDEADQIMSNLGINDRGILYNLDPNKPAQINQRIKNALGSRLMYEVNSEVSNVLNSGGSLLAFKDKKIAEVNSTLSMLVGLLGEDDQAKKFISNYLSSEEVNLATMFDTDVRTVLSESAYNYVVKQRDELFNVFKDVEMDDQQKNNVTSALNYMFRLKMINYSSVPNSISSVVGGRRDKPQFMILQLNGGYSDHFYLNPKFRTDHFAGMPVTTTTGIKSSMLDRRTYVGTINLDGSKLERDGLVIREGDMFMYDKGVNKVVQYRDGTPMLEGTYVGGTGSSDYLKGQIENFSFGGKPVASVKQRSTSNRPGEDSVQYILTAKRREGANPDTSELIYEVSVLNMLKTGSGRRQEGTASGTLFKGVGAYIDEGQFTNLYNSFKQASVGVNSFSKMNVALSDVYGLINPNNLKSGFFVGHGAALLTSTVMNDDGNKERMARVLIRQEEKQLAAAIISQFGFDITKGDFDSTRQEYIANERAIAAYKSGALKGEFGTYLRLLELQRTIAGKNIQSADNIFGSVPQFILQDRALSKAINNALLGQESNLKDLLGDYINEVIGKTEGSSKGYLVNSSDMYVKGVTALLTAIDMFSQLKNQKGDIQFVTDWLLKTKNRENNNLDTNDALVEIAAAIGGSSNAFNMSRDEKDELANMMGNYMQNNYAVALALNILPSPNKDPLGKNLRAKTELQHLLKPLSAQTEQFKRVGGKDSLAFVLGTIFAAQETTLISLGMADSKAYLDRIQHINALDITTVSGFFGHKFLGMYYNANSNTKDLMLQYKKIYKDGVRSGFDISKVDLYLEDGSLSMAEAIYADSKIKGGTISYSQRLRNMAEHITNELREEAIKYNLEESKGMGTDITTPKLKVLQEMGSRTYNILMPEIVGNQYQNEITGDWNTVFSNSQSRYIFMPGAELLNQVGSSFGDFVSEIVGKSINMYSYFTPGTAENDLMRKIASARHRQSGNQQFNINLSVEETQMITKLYNLGDELLQSIVEASSDTLMQKAIAGHGTEFAGYVSTPIPNLALNYNMNVSPDYANERYGAPEAIAEVRKKWLEDTTSAHIKYTTYGQELDTRFSYYKHDKQVRDFTKTMGVVLDYQRHMLVKGLSSPAISKLIGEGGAIKVIENAQTLISDLELSNNKKGFDTSYIDKQLEKFQNSFIKTKKELANTGAYDEAYVSSYIVANLQLAKIKADYIRKGDSNAINTINSWMSDRGYKDAIYLGGNHEIRDFIHNIANRKDYKEGLDLANYYGREMEVAMRGKHTVYKPVNESLNELINFTNKTEGINKAIGVTTEYIDKRIKTLESFIDNFAPTSQANAKTKQEHIIVKANRDSVDRMIKDMQNIRDQVADYQGKDVGFLHYSLTELGFIHNSMSELDSMQNNSWRSAPFGSTESHLGTLMAVRGIHQFNDMMTNLTDDAGIVRFDKDRGKSLSMFSGLSFLTSNLGDFDGDNYITLLHKVTEKIQSIDDRQGVIGLYKAKLNSPLVLKNSLSNEDHTKLQQTLAREEEKLQHDVLTLQDLQLDLNKPKEQGKMAKDVAAYMGIDSRFFLGQSEKGFRDHTVAISSMAALLEQGKGLYGGLAGVSSEINTRVNDLLDNGPAAGLSFDKKSMDTFIDSMNDTNQASKMFTALGMDQDFGSLDGKTQQEMTGALQDAMRLSFEQTQSRMNKDLNQLGETSTTEFYQALVGKLHSTTKASDALGKVMGAGIGIAMGESTYDVLTKVLGEAGSDVLGKTYNTLLGTFVADSPVVSLYHILEGHSGHIADEMNKQAGGTVGDEFMANIQAAYTKAQDLQGWNKAIQQMLRDSIKLKGDSKSVMRELSKLSVDYEQGNEDKRIQLVNEMASKIGPGAGMKGLMNLNRMIHAGAGNYGNAKEDYHLINGERDIAERLTGYTGDEDALIKYKVSNQLRSITTMFNFEKNFGSIDVVKGKLTIENKANSNRALEQVIQEGLHGFLGEKPSSTMLLLAEHATGSRDRALELTNSLYSSIEGINKLTASKKIISNGQTNYIGGPISVEERNKMIASEFNHYANQLITSNDSGVFGVMLGDHANIVMNDENKSKLNEVRNDGNGLSTSALLVLNHYQSLVQTKSFLGDYGEGLDRFVHLNHASKTMQANITRNFNEVGTNLLGSDLFNAAYRLMAQGKLSSQGGNVMTRLFKAVNDPNMTNANAMGKMLSNFSGDEDSARDLAEQYEHLKHVEIQHESTIDGINLKKETVGDLINRKSKQTSQGFKLAAISDIAEALKDSGDMSAITYESISKKVKVGLVNPNEADQVVKDLMNEQGLLLGGLTQEGKDYFKPTIVHRGSSNANTNANVLKSNVAEGAFNTLGPAVLSMLGGVIYGTSKDEAGMDVAGVVGGTLSLMGFNMPHGKGAANVAGALFRSRAYNNPDEDWATNIAKAASTELSMGLVGHYVTPKLTEVFNRNIVAPLVKNNLAIAESGVAAILGSFVGAIAMNMLDSTIQQSAGLLKNNFNQGDNNLNNRLAQLQDNLSDVLADRSDAELDPMSADRFLDVVDKLDIPPLVVGVWATDREIEAMNNNGSSDDTYLLGGETTVV